MLPEDVSRKLGARVKNVLLKHGIAGASLTNAVRTVMQTSGWHTVVNVRTLLQQHGFDFSEYKTNALASVAATTQRRHELVLVLLVRTSAMGAAVTTISSGTERSTTTSSVVASGVKSRAM